MIISRLHCVLRPDANGNWFIQDDEDHGQFGFYSVDQFPTHLRLNFMSTYDKAGTVQISSDDDFAGSVLASANLGLSSMNIKIRVAPNTTGESAPIVPSQIWAHLPRHIPGSGNLWINATMLHLA